MFLKRILKKTSPKLYKGLKLANSNISFSGWGMTLTTTINPWEKTNSKIHNYFNSLNKNLLSLVEKGKFKLNQFKASDKKKMKKVEELSWRHYLLFMLAIFAVKKTKIKKKVFVECGVSDGLTSYFIINAISKFTSNYFCFLFDSWSVMKNVSKKKEEEKMVGSFDRININDTKLNLKRYTNKINFIKGLIPDSFKNQNRIKNITMLHIDLNSALATEKSLNFFFKKIVSNGIIVFDDYGWKDFELTKILVDKFLRNKDGLFLQLPTGQGVFIKK